MSTRALFGVLLLMSFGWLFIYAAPIHNELMVLRAADGYRESDLLVTEASCVTSRSSDGPSDTLCYLEGTVDGQRAELFTGSSLPPEYPEGSRARVLFNPSMPDAGWNRQSLRVVRWEPDLASASRRRVLLMLAVVAASLLLTTLVNVALRRGIRRRSHAREGAFSADLGGGTPHVGVPLAAMGLLFLFGQLTGGGIAVAGVILGLASAGAGAWLMRRRYAATERHSNHLTIGEHVLGFTTKAQSVETGGRCAIRLHGGKAPWTLSLRGADDAETAIARLSSLPAARRAGAGLAEAAGCEWRDEVIDQVREKAPSFFLPTTETGRIGLVLFVAIVAGTAWYAWQTWQKPQTRERVALALVEPGGSVVDFQNVPALRAWAARELAVQHTPPALLGVIRLLNTIDPEGQAEVAAAGMGALHAAAGLEPQGEWYEQLARMNRWAAERTGRALDAHGGVLLWFPVSEGVQSALEAIGGRDPREAWLAWTHFGAGSLTNPEAFLYAAGGALGDRRPIPFAIHRTSAPGAPLEFEGQPEPPGADALAHTVGEAMALHMWWYDGVHDEALTGEFRSWWSDYAARRLLPPLPQPLR